MANDTKKEEKKSSKGSWSLLGRIFMLAMPYKKFVVLSIILTLLGAWLAPFRTNYIRIMLDDYVAKGDAEGLIRITYILIGLLLLNAFVNFGQSWVTAFLGQAVIKDLRLRVYEFATRLKLKYFDKTPVGTVVTRTVSDIESLSTVFSSGFIIIAGDLLQIGVILYFMFSTNWQLTLVCLSVLPFLIVATYIFKEKVKTSFTQVRNAVSNLNAFVQEHISGMQIVQIFNREKEEYKRFEGINTLHKNANIKSVLYYALFFPVVEIITATATALVVWYGIRQSIGGSSIS